MRAPWQRDVNTGLLRVPDQDCVLFCFTSWCCQVLQGGTGPNRTPRPEPAPPGGTDEFLLQLSGVIRGCGSLPTFCPKSPLSIKAVSFPPPRGAFKTTRLPLIPPSPSLAHSSPWRKRRLVGLRCVRSAHEAERSLLARHAAFRALSRSLNRAGRTRRERAAEQISVCVFVSVCMHMSICV